MEGDGRDGKRESKATYENVTQDPINLKTALYMVIIGFDLSNVPR